VPLVFQEPRDGQPVRDHDRRERDDEQSSHPERLRCLRSLVVLLGRGDRVERDRDIDVAGRERDGRQARQRHVFHGRPEYQFFDIGGGTTGTGASLSSGSATNTVNATDSVYVGAVALEDTTNPTTATATVGTEVHDLYDATNQQGLWSGYLLVSSSASRAVTATASNSASTSNTGALAIYAGIAGAAATAAVAPPQRGPLGL
jgi:hypothetical protein